MSFSTLRVELPAYSHSFQVQVTPSSSVRDVKHEITKVCPGSPSPEGQRLIWRGRFLRDEEKLEDIWKVRRRYVTCSLRSLTPVLSR